MSTYPRTLRSPRRSPLPAPGTCGDRSWGSSTLTPGSGGRGQSPRASRRGGPRTPGHGVVAGRRADERLGRKTWRPRDQSDQERQLGVCCWQKNEHVRGCCDRRSMGTEGSLCGCSEQPEGASAGRRKREEPLPAHRRPLSHQDVSGLHVAMQVPRCVQPHQRPRNVSKNRDEVDLRRFPSTVRRLSTNMDLRDDVAHLAETDHMFRTLSRR